MVADGASSRSTERTVHRHVAGHAADDGTLDASLRFGGEIEAIASRPVAGAALRSLFPGIFAKFAWSRRRAS